MRKLETSPTLRKPDLSELPKSSDSIQKLNELDEANIVEGYTLAFNTSKDNNFEFYAEININNSRLWNLMKSLILQFPEEISFIFNYLDEDTFYGEYEDKFSLLNKIETFQLELTQDCFLDFGIISQTRICLDEIFIDSAKYLKYWGSNEVKFREIMNEYDLNEIPDLRFVDEFPLVRERLGNYNTRAIDTYNLIEKLKILFHLIN